jgi:squamous cell carcinoma antigen recognized by T-cells 3
MVAVSKLRGPAVKAYDRREASERSLVSTALSPICTRAEHIIPQAQAKFSLEAYAYYIAAERRMKNPDLFIIRGLYERAIAEAARRRFAGEAGAEEALRSFWGGYCDVLVRHNLPGRQHVLNVLVT